MSIAQDILDLIHAQPGIRSVEIEERLDIANAASKIGHHVLAGRIRTERVQAPNGRWVTAYFPAAAAAEEGMAMAASPHGSEGRRSRDGAAPWRHQQRPGSLVAALYSNGDLVIELGGKRLRLTAQETRDLIAYLDRINVDQIIPPKPGVTRHIAE